MYENNEYQYATVETRVNDPVAVSQLFKVTYFWMALALAVSGAVALFASNSGVVMNAIFGNQLVFWGLAIAELALVIILSANVWRMSFGTATFLFWVYAVLNGLVLSSIFVVYTTASIASVFFISAGMFGAMSLYGFMTKKDLTKIGNILFMTLIGLIIATVVNIFWANGPLYWIITYVGVALFAGLTAYGTHVLKRIYSDPAVATMDQPQKVALLGALNLYLDVINLFLYLLRIFGNRD